MYYAVDRATMAFKWKASAGPGSGIGGFVGSTAYDGTRIYGTNALTSQVTAIGRDGIVQWSSPDGGSLDFSPLAIANGVLYTANPGGMLAMREAKTGTVLKTISLGGATFGGMSTVGGSVYASVGTGPPPPPAPQESSTGSIVALGDTSRSRGPLSGGAPRPSRPGVKRRSKCRAPRGARMRLRVRPRRVRAGRRRAFRFRATCKGRPVRRAVVRFAHRRKRTGRHGRATIVVRFRHRGRHVARVTKRHLRRGRAVVRVRR
jgi:hypothetical protein